MRSSGVKVSRALLVPMMTLRAPADLSLQAARVRLRAPGRGEAVLPALGAAALCAISALALAGAVILGPPGTAHATAASVASMR